MRWQAALAACQPVLLGFDADAGGAEAASYWQSVLGNQARIWLPYQDDPAAMLAGGGELTIDHFHPRAHGGSDELDNLLYCCNRCNQYKLAYWPARPSAPVLWNPRVSPRDEHFLALDDGTLYPLTDIGAFTLKRLRLNRPPLIAYRLRQQARGEEARLLARYRDLLTALEQVTQQQAALLEEQRQLLRLLREQRG